MAAKMMYIKQEFKQEFRMEEDPRRQPPHSPSPEPSIPITSVTNENWRGKNDSAERRRIQNRINQRAFRQRQRAGESPKQYKPRSQSSGSGARSGDDEQPTPSPDQEQPPFAHQSLASTAATSARPSGVTDTATGLVWDELAQLINRNLMSAAANNAQHLRLDLSALQTARAALTPRAANSQLPASLQPTALQHQVPHDPIIDIIPHARFRHNVLNAIAARRLDAAAFSTAVRASGALENTQGTWSRGGLVVWSSPEQLASWELSESFVQRFALLLQGCDDLLAATNAWRSRRGERPFATSTGERR